MDPRIARTRAEVLRTALTLLGDGGPSQLSFSKIAVQAGVSRQTLYSHWETLERLIADAILDGFEGGYPEPATSITETLRGWLTSLRDGNSEPARAVAIVTLAAHAFHDQSSAAALRHIMLDRHAALNRLLETFNVEVSADDLALLNGPVLFSLFFLHQPVTEQMINQIVDQANRTLFRNTFADDVDGGVDTFGADPVAGDHRHGRARRSS